MSCKCNYFQDEHFLYLHFKIFLLSKANNFFQSMLRKNMVSIFRTLTIALLLCFSTISYAGDYDFRLHNRSSGWIIDGFYTFQNGRWSKNWLRNPIVAGQGVNMHWASDEGNCVVPFRVEWRNYGSEDHRLDWCKGVSHVYMKDKGFSWN